MKRYLIFTGEAYYPRGGAQDLTYCVDHLSEAELQLKRDLAEGFSWVNMYDTHTNDFYVAYLVAGNLQWELSENKRCRLPVRIESTILRKMEEHNVDYADMSDTFQKIYRCIPDCKKEEYLSEEQAVYEYIDKYYESLR